MAPAHSSQRLGADMNSGLPSARSACARCTVEHFSRRPSRLEVVDGLHLQAGRRPFPPPLGCPPTHPRGAHPAPPSRRGSSSPPSRRQRCAVLAAHQGWSLCPLGRPLGGRGKGEQLAHLERSTLGCRMTAEGIAAARSAVQPIWPWQLEIISLVQERPRAIFGRHRGLGGGRSGANMLQFTQISAATAWHFDRREKWGEGRVSVAGGARLARATAGRRADTRCSWGTTRRRAQHRVAGGLRLHPDRVGAGLHRVLHAWLRRPRDVQLLLTRHLTHGGRRPRATPPRAPFPSPSAL